jgi:hypothetical protein
VQRSDKIIVSNDIQRTGSAVQRKQGFKVDKAHMTFPSAYKRQIARPRPMAGDQDNVIQFGVEVHKPMRVEICNQSKHCHNKFYAITFIHGSGK